MENNQLSYINVTRSNRRWNTSIKFTDIIVIAKGYGNILEWRLQLRIFADHAINQRADTVQSFTLLLFLAIEGGGRLTKAAVFSRLERGVVFATLLFSNNVHEVLKKEREKQSFEINENKEIEVL